MRVGNVRQEEYGLEEVLELRDRVEPHGDQECDRRRQRNCDDNQNERVLEGLQEIRVPQDIRVIVLTYTKIGLGGEVVPFLQGVDHDVEQGIDHEDAQKDHRREQVQPGFIVVFIHYAPPSFLTEAERICSGLWRRSQCQTDRSCSV